MKKLIPILFFTFLFQNVLFSQPLTGVKSIPGDYSTFTDAFNALNSNGVGTGGVVFNVSTGAVFNERPPVLTVKGTSANRVVFQKSGSGNNPKIIPNSAGTIDPPASFRHVDAVIRLSGARYVTFDGIDIEENTSFTTATEYTETGYYILKENATSGCKNIEIKNCTIKLNSSYVKASAVFVTDRDPAGNSIAATNKQGTHQNFKLNNVTSDSVFSGFMKYQSVSVFYDSLADDSVDIGVEAGNNFNHIGGTMIGTAVGIKIVSDWQRNVRIHNNTITGRKNDWTGDTWGIDVGNMPMADISIQNNIIQDFKAYNTLKGIINSGGNKKNNSTNAVVIKNNIVRNCSFSMLASTQVIWSFCSAPTVIIQNNLIDSISGIASGTCFYNTTNPDSLLIKGNTIRNCDFTGGFTGIHSDNPTALSVTIDSNFIYDCASNGKTYMVYAKSSSSTNVYRITRNSFQNISGSEQKAIHTECGGYVYINNNYLSKLSGDIVHGIYVFKSPVYCAIYNNVIAGFSSGASLGGITLAQAGNYGIYYNSVYLDAINPGTSTFSSSCLDIQFSSTSIDLANNNFVNLSEKGTSGKRVVIKSSSGLGNILSSTSGHNNYYAGTPSSVNLISHIGTTVFDSTLAQHKAFLYPGDQTSVTELPPFKNTSTLPYNLDIDTTIPSQLNGQAIPITSPIAITTDYNFNIRSSTAPDIGAYEITSSLTLDKNGPIIIIPEFLSNGIIAPSRVLSNVKIIDPSNVKKAVGSRPRIYYKKNSEPNAFNGNTSAVSGWKWTESTVINDSTFDFKIDYLLLKDSLKNGDIILYFIVASDSAATPNIGSQGAILQSVPTTVDLNSSSFPAVNRIDSFFIKEGIQGVVTVGNGGMFPSLTGFGGLFSWINPRILYGDLTVKIISNTTEPAIYTLKALDKYENKPFVLKIEPDSAKTYKLSGNLKGTLFSIELAKDIVIDGSYNNEGRYLHFENTSSNIPCGVLLIGGRQLSPYYPSEGLTLKNCIFSLPNAVKSYNNIAVQINNFSPFSSGKMERILIENNHVYDVGTGIYMTGQSSAANPISNVIIRENNFGRYDNKGFIKANAIYAEYVDSILIEENYFDNIERDGVLLAANAENVKVLSNRFENYGGGSYEAAAVHVETGLANSNIDLINNVISNNQDLVLPATGSNVLHGIVIHDKATLVTGGVNVLHNSIRLSGNRDVSTFIATAALSLDNGSLINIRNNILYNDIINLGNSSSKAYGFTSDYYFDTSLNAFDNNIIYTGNQGVTAKYLNKDVKTLADLKAASTIYFQNCMSCDPEFYTPNNLRASASCVVNNGAPVSVLTDITGEPRSTTTPTIGAYEFNEYNKDVAITNLFDFVECGTDSLYINCVVRNVGLNTQSNFDVNIDITGDKTASVSHTYSGALLAKKNDTITIKTGITALSNTQLTIKVYLSLSGDQNRKNDSSQYRYNYSGFIEPVVTITNDTICGGGVLSLKATSPNSIINWYADSLSSTSIYTGNTFVTPFITSSTPYFAVANDTTSSCISQRIKAQAIVHVIDSVDIGGDTSICIGNNIIFTANKTFKTYLWNTNSTTPSIITSLQGKYWIRVSDKNGCISSDTVNVGLSTDCVWPGDANSDGVANNYDVLEVGLQYGKKGRPRANAAIFWAAQPAVNWADTLSNGLNMKFADCNGDSTINASDTIAIIKNYNKIHSKTGGSIEGTPLDIPLYLKYAKDTVSSGEWVTADLMLSDLSSNISIYGIAFTLSYPQQVQPHSMVWDISDSWMFANAEQRIGFYYYVVDSVSEDVSISRINQQNKTGNGKIASLRFKLKDKQDTATITMFPYWVRLIDNKGKILPVYNLPRNNLTVKDEATTVAEVKQTDITLYPNPVTNSFRLIAESRGINSIEIVDLVGRRVLFIENPETNSVEVDVTTLNAGTYFVRVATDNSVCIKKIVIR